MTRTFTHLFALCLLALCGAAPASAQDSLTAPPVNGSGAVKIDVSFLLVDVMGIHDADQEISADLFYRL